MILPRQDEDFHGGIYIQIVYMLSNYSRIGDASQLRLMWRGLLEHETALSRFRELGNFQK